MIPLQGTSSPGDVIEVVDEVPVLDRDQSPVRSDARPSSSTPVRQEDAADEPIVVGVEVHVVSDSEQEGNDVSGSPLEALARMTLGTQTGGGLPRRSDPEDTGLHLTIDPARPLAELVARMQPNSHPLKAELQVD